MFGNVTGVTGGVSADVCRRSPAAVCWGSSVREFDDIIKRTGSVMALRMEPSESRVNKTTVDNDE